MKPLTEYTDHSASLYVNLHMSQLLGHNQPIRSNEGPSSGLYSLLSSLSEGYVGPPGVPPIERPFGLAMANEKDARS